MSVEEPSKTCRECGIDKSFLQKQIRRLREKLDHSQLRIHSLERDYERMRDELREAKWNGFSTVKSRPPPPTFPTEILRAIFGYATSMNGLTFAHWHNRTKRDSWATISFTRRSIPLVCRNWYIVGSEFLYRHIVLFTRQQAQSLRNVLIYSNHPLSQIQKEAIRGIELLFEASSIDEDIEQYLSHAKEILKALPREQLRLFSIEETHCKNEKRAIQDIATIVLDRNRDSLETLNLPSVTYDMSWEVAILYATPRDDKLILSKLHTLSIANECWWFVSTGGNSDHLSKIVYPSLRELSIEWNRSSPANVLPLIRSVQRNLRRLHVVDYNNTTIHDIESILEWLPSLEHLSVFYNSQVGGREARNSVVASNKHLCLKEVVVWMKTTIGYKSILSMGPLFSLIKLGQIPSLNSIMICGRFPGGCIDRDIIMPRQVDAAWRDAIKLCKKKRIALVNSSGDPMHAWTMQNGIRWENEASNTKSGDPSLDTNANPGSTTQSDHPPTQDSTEAGDENANSSDSQDEASSEEEMSSDEDNWAEVETDKSFEGSEISSSENISDDSEDTPYQYAHQFDIDIVYSDSD